MSTEGEAVLIHLDPQHELLEGTRSSSMLATGKKVGRFKPSAFKSATHIAFLMSVLCTDRALLAPELRARMVTCRNHGPRVRFVLRDPVGLTDVDCGSCRGDVVFRVGTRVHGRPSGQRCTDDDTSASDWHQGGIKSVRGKSKPHVPTRNTGDGPPLDYLSPMSPAHSAAANWNHEWISDPLGGRN